VRAALVTINTTEVTSVARLRRQLGAYVEGCENVKCSLFNELGVQIKQLQDVRDNQRVFLVRPGKLFVFPTFEIGHKVCPLFGLLGCCSLSFIGHSRLRPASAVFSLPQVVVKHIINDDGKPVELVTLSKSPRVFSLSNFFTEADADQLIHNALSITDPEFMLKRSTTGTKGKEVRGERHGSVVCIRQGC